jgi:hypothetical protein
MRLGLGPRNAVLFEVLDEAKGIDRLGHSRLRLRSPAVYHTFNSVGSPRL